MAKLVFRIICGDGNHKAQFDEQLRLIKADTPAAAFERATRYAINEEDAFVNSNDKMVQWKFINIAELYKISALIDGAELYSRIQESDNAQFYIEMVNKKAAYIQANSEEIFSQSY